MLNECKAVVGDPDLEFKVPLPYGWVGEFSGVGHFFRRAGEGYLNRSAKSERKKKKKHRNLSKHGVFLGMTKITRP